MVDGGGAFVGHSPSTINHRLVPILYILYILVRYCRSPESRAGGGLVSRGGGGAGGARGGGAAGAGRTAPRGSSGGARVVEYGAGSAVPGGERHPRRAWDRGGGPGDGPRGSGCRFWLWGRLHARPAHGRSPPAHR